MGNCWWRAGAAGEKTSNKLARHIIIVAIASIQFYYRSRGSNSIILTSICFQFLHNVLYSFVIHVLDSPGFVFRDSVGSILVLTSVFKS